MRYQFLFISGLVALAAAPTTPESFRFVLLGDRTGEAQPRVYERVWKAISREKPAFVPTAGDTIEGLHDEAAAGEWQAFERTREPFKGIPFYLTPGNHDVWSAESERLYLQHSGRNIHYSFDYGPAHFTILDNSRSEDLAASELAFLEEDLKAHSSQPIKFIVSHRPGWIFNVLLRNGSFPLHQLARKYGVQYVIAGHVHQMMHFTLDGIEYISLPSAGGHLRASGQYEDGWFFGFTEIEIRKNEAKFDVHPLEGEVTPLAAWGPLGRLAKTPASH